MQVRAAQCGNEPRNSVQIPYNDDNAFDEWGRSTDRYRNFIRPDPELAMIDMKRQHQRAKDERLPGETMHDALRRVAGIS